MTTHAILVLARTVLCAQRLTQSQRFTDPAYFDIKRAIVECVDGAAGPRDLTEDEWPVFEVLYMHLYYTDYPLTKEGVHAARTTFGGWPDSRRQHAPGSGSEVPDRGHGAPHL